MNGGSFGAGSDAIVFLGHKANTSLENGVHITRVRSFDNLAIDSSHKVDFKKAEDISIELNGFLLPIGMVSELAKTKRRFAPISHFADSAPGIVSAANNYFILSEAIAKENQISKHMLPILKKGSFVGCSPVFGKHDFAALKSKGPALLLAVQGDKNSLDENLAKYIAKGEALGLHERYKCRHRTNWYQVPLVKPEQGFFFKRSHSFPRVLLNHAGVYITDTAYGLRMKDQFTIRGLCFSFYTSLTMLFAEMTGRFYGGGVLELSPTEFRSLPLVYFEPSDKDWEAFLSAHAAAEGDAERILDFGDSWLSRNQTFTFDELKDIRQSWRTVRAHRMRHGGRKLAKPPKNTTTAII